MNTKRTLIWALCVGSLVGFALAPSPAAADSATITGTVVVFGGEDMEEESPDVYIRTEDSEYFVSGPEKATLTKHDGKTVTATGSITEDEYGEQVIEVKTFRVAME
jgi:hypothetical protein